MNNQFFYVTVGMDGNPAIGSFHLDEVMRTLQHGKGLVVLLCDGHEEVRIRYKRDSSGAPIIKAGKPVEESRLREWVTSEIYLDESDFKRFLSLYLSPHEVKSLEIRIEGMKEVENKVPEVAHYEDGL